MSHMQKSERALHSINRGPLQESTDFYKKSPAFMNKSCNICKSPKEHYIMLNEAHSKRALHSIKEPYSHD